MSQLIEGTTMTDNLLPCPFCGGDARADSHADDCYFTLHRALNKAPDGDASLQLEVLEAWNRRAALEAGRAAVPAERDVTSILLDIQPGFDGMGVEVYAKTVRDVEDRLTAMGQELEEWQLGIRRHPTAAAVPAGWVLVPVELLKRAESSLGSFCSDHGWGDADMQTMDDISGLLAAAPQPVAQPSETQWQKRHHLRTEGEWENTNEHDAKWWRNNSQGWEIRVLYADPAAQAKPEQAAQPKQAACEQTIKKELPMLSISDEQAEAIASEVYVRNPVDGVDAAFKLDWELIRAGISYAEALNTDDSCPHGNAHIVHDCLRCGAPVCCGKCCADDAANEPDAAGEIAYQLTKKLVIDMPTARAAVDAAIAAIPVAQPLTPKQRRALIDAAGDTTDGLNQGDFADEIVRAVERHHGITASPKD